jgi:hypothetical protein
MVIFPLVWLNYWRGAMDLGRRRSLGRCLGCGYDLRASSGRCPECGMAKKPHIITAYSIRMGPPVREKFHLRVIAAMVLANSVLLGITSALALYLGLWWAFLLSALSITLFLGCLLILMDSVLH